MRCVIYTVIVGGYDRLIEPEGYPGWDFVCFTDAKCIGWRAKLGLSRWQVRTFDDPELDTWRTSRLPKILPHRYLADYDYSVYIDGNAKLLSDPATFLDQINWPDFAVSTHPYRDKVFDEIEECIRQNKAPHDVLAAQREAYHADGLPADTALLENNFLLRRHNAPAVIELMESWWMQMNTHSHRDQLSLPYVTWKQGFAPYVFSQNEKQTFFTTKAHYRSPWSRWKRSWQKRFPPHSS